MSAFFLVEYARRGLLLASPGLAAAGFCGLITIGFGREGIDGGRICFGDFGGGDPAGSAGSGGFGKFGGKGGCNLLVLRLGEIRCTNSGSSGNTFFGVVSACFLLEFALAYLT